MTFAVLVLFAALSGLVVLGGGAIFSLLSEKYPPALAPAAVGYADVFGILSSVVAPWLMGMITGASADAFTGAFAAGADDDRNPAGHALDEILGECRRFGVAELLRLAHHAEDGHAAHAFAEIELDKRIDARPVDVAPFGERCHGDDEYAATVGADLVWRGRALGCWDVCSGAARLTPPRRGGARMKRGAANP